MIGTMGDAGAAVATAGRVGGGVAEQPVKVSAEALLVAYSHLWMLKQMNDGVDRQTAFTESARWFFHILLPGSGKPGHLNPVDRNDSIPLPCLARSTRLSVEALEMNWEDRRRSEPNGGCAVIAESTRQTLLWTEAAARRISDGQSVGEAARGARDLAAGKPRQRRSPMPPEELRPILERTIGEVWAALRESTAPGGFLGPVPFLDPCYLLERLHPRLDRAALWRLLQTPPTPDEWNDLRRR